MLVVLFAATLVSSVFFWHILQDTKTLIKNGTNAVGATFILQDLELNLQNAESAQRGYIITGDEKYLGPYNSAIKRIPPEQKMLSGIEYGINPDKLKELNSLISHHLRGMEYAINLRKNGDVEAANNATMTNAGLTSTTSIQGIVGTIAQQKIAPVSGLYDRTQNSLQVAFIVAGALIGSVFVICVLIFWHFQRTIQRERAIEGVKNEFLSLASHQLRTPATNVKQYLGLLLEGYLGKLTPKQRDAIKVADRSNEMEINIINDLLGVAKLDLNKIHLNKEPINLYSMAKEVIDAHSQSLREQRQVVRFDKASNKKTKVYADRIYLKSVFQNLLDNASKYSPKDTKILIKITERPHKAILSIQDEGVGMKKREMDKLFKKFSRIPSEYTNNTEGSGLGLYWVKQIVELHGGSIKVKSSPKRGSIFSVELPL